MKLHENKELFKKIVDSIVQIYDYSEDIVMKDYYVCLVLKEIYQNHRASYTKVKLNL